MPLCLQGIMLEWLQWQWTSIGTTTCMIMLSPDVSNQVCEHYEANGWLTPAQRRKLWSSKRWIVHLFAGVEGHWQIMRLDQGDAMAIELDSARCAGQDLLRSETWRMLLWGAVMGKVDVVMGGPPDRVHQHCRGGERDTKALQLIARMMWLFVVAQSSW